MTKTVDFDLTSAYQEVANSTTDTSVTIYNSSSYTLGVVIDDRDESTRITDGDEDGVVLIPPGNDRFFSGFDGAVTAKHMTSLAVGCKIAVVKS